MMRRRPDAARRSVAFAWKIVCKSGALSFGCHADFLLTIVIAKQQKARWAAMLPSSTLRVHLLYPNGQRVSKYDIKSALSALSDQRIMSLVASRSLSAFTSTDLGAARGRASEGASGGFANFDDASFRQAGVVAPPDSPDLGNPVEVASVALGA